MIKNALNVYSKQGHSAINDNLNNARAVSLYTGPMMYGRGWNKKVQRWTQGHLTGNVGSSHDLYLSGTNPKKIRLRNASPAQARVLTASSPQQQGFNPTARPKPNLRDETSGGTLQPRAMSVQEVKGPKAFFEKYVAKP